MIWQVFNLLHVAVAALGGAVLMVIIGILPPRLLYEPVEWRTIVLVAGMNPLGVVMVKSGVVGLVSSLIAITLVTLGPHITMMGIMLIALLLASDTIPARGSRSGGHDPGSIRYSLA